MDGTAGRAGDEGGSLAVLASRVGGRLAHWLACWCGSASQSEGQVDGQCRVVGKHRAERRRRRSPLPARPLPPQYGTSTKALIEANPELADPTKLQ